MDKSALFQQFVAFTAAVHQITNEMTKDVRTDDVTLLQYKILEYVAVRQPLTLSDISECMHMSLPNTSRELKKLIEKRLCKKVTSTKDRRKQFIQLTDEGEAMMGEAFRQVQARFHQRIEKATEEELQEMEHALKLLHAKVFY